jgi:peptidase E
MTLTELVYSSHDRCHHIHRDWIVQRALESRDNKTILYLPVSSGAKGDQEYSQGTFSWYFDRYRSDGLQPRYFIYRDDLRRDDVQLFFDWVRSSQVVILGGGRTSTGLERYRSMGERFFGNPDAFAQTLQARQAQGLLTVGFSAGAAQLCEHSCDDDSGPTFGLLAKVVVTLHYEAASAGHVQLLAHRHPDCLVFGLPNDSGIAVGRGFTGRDNYWQLIQFIHDCSWDKPEDHHHIKTRQGVKIEHRYADGRSWGFNGGDVLLRVFFKGGGWEAWVKRPEVPTFHEYGTQRECGYRSVEEILGGR